MTLQKPNKFFQFFIHAIPLPPWRQGYVFAQLNCNTIYVKTLASFVLFYFCLVLSTFQVKKSCYSYFCFIYALMSPLYHVHTGHLRIADGVHLFDGVGALLLLIAVIDARINQPLYIAVFDKTQDIKQP